MPENIKIIDNIIAPGFGLETSQATRSRDSQGAKEKQIVRLQKCGKTVVPDGDKLIEDIENAVNEAVAGLRSALKLK